MIYLPWSSAKKYSISLIKLLDLFSLIPLFPLIHILLKAVSKMCIKGNKGINLNKPKFLINEIEYFFAEDQGRYIIEINPKDLKDVNKILDKNSVHHEELGVIVEKDMIINEKTKVTIDELKSYYTNWLSNYMSS